MHVVTGRRGALVTQLTKLPIIIHVDRGTWSEASATPPSRRTAKCSFAARRLPPGRGRKVSDNFAILRVQYPAAPFAGTIRRASALTYISGKYPAESLSRIAKCHVTTCRVTFPSRKLSERAIPRFSPVNPTLRLYRRRTCDVKQNDGEKLDVIM